jgi:hypothetical protein
MDRRTGRLTGVSIAALCLAAATACASTVEPGAADAPSSAPPATPVTSAASAPSSAAPSSSAPSASGPSPSGTGGSASGACAPAQLTVKADTSAAATGYSDLLIEVTNAGTAACELSGFPTVAGTLSSGGTVHGRDTADVHLGMVDPGTAPGPVTLAPGANAWIPLNFDDNPLNGANSCPAFSTFAVTLPGVARAFSVSALEYGSVYAPDCDGIEVPPVLSTADTVVPPAG